MIKARTWNGKNLQGVWRVYRKLDGVRALVVRDRVVSRRGKPLYNLDHLKHLFTDAEVWKGNFRDTIVAVRTKTIMAVHRYEVYQLEPPDKRLYLCAVASPDAKFIRTLLDRYKRKGEDGLVLRQEDVWLKVKHVNTYDVKVTGLVEGAGKHKGRLGTALTAKGAVGTGFSDAERERYWQSRKLLLGKIIEVSCLSLTPDGKFRHARFIRLREDKS